MRAAGERSGLELGRIAADQPVLAVETRIEEAIGDALHGLYLKDLVVAETGPDINLPDTPHGANATAAEHLDETADVARDPVRWQPRSVAAGVGLPGGGSPAGSASSPRSSSVAGLIALLLLAPPSRRPLVANNYLQGMQIDVEGDNHRHRAAEGRDLDGSGALHSGTADPGTIGLLGVKLSLRNLIERQALLQSVVLRDVDVSISNRGRRDYSSTASCCASLAEQAADRNTEARARDPAEGGGSRWGAGIDDMQVRDRASPSPTGTAALLSCTSSISTCAASAPGSRTSRGRSC